MRFCILGSGSAGNCALLQTSGARVLVDAGFSARKTAALLASVGASLDHIDAIFLTHEHGDHSAVLAGLARFPRIKVFANPATARALQAPLRHKPDWQLFETGARFHFLDLEVESFSVPHDAQDPVGFVFSHRSETAPVAHVAPVGPDLVSGRECIGGTNAAGDVAPASSRPDTRSGPTAAATLAWLTDLGHAPMHIRERIREVDVLVVEANHCPDLLQADDRRPWALKQRIAGRHGHLSNPAARELLETVASPRWRRVYLTHLSRDCNSLDAIHRAFSGIETALPCPLSIVEPGQITPFFDF
jgi:phosphoribosyl 1,2-cyclic phosphodiesterase